MRPLGDTQNSVMESLQRHSGFWYLNCGWLWDTASNTTKIMESLVKRGLVTKTELPEQRPQQITLYRYDLTMAGEEYRVRR